MSPTAHIPFSSPRRASFAPERPSARREWSKVVPDGTPPSARAAHAAATVGNMVVIQGGIGPHGLADNDLHVLDFSNMARPKVCDGTRGARHWG